MLVSKHGQTDARDLQRMGLESDLRGSIGKRRFDAEHGVALRGSHPDALSGQGSVSVNLKFCVNPATR